MTLVVLAVWAVLPADLAVLFGILDNRFAGIKHALVRFVGMDNRSFYVGCPGLLKKNRAAHVSSRRFDP
jgi:hypothetical protein